MYCCHFLSTCILYGFFCVTISYLLHSGCLIDIALYKVYMCLLHSVKCACGFDIIVSGIDGRDLTDTPYFYGVSRFFGGKELYTDL